MTKAGVPPANRATRVVLRVGIYYVLLLAAGYLVLPLIGAAPSLADVSRATLFGGDAADAARGVAPPPDNAALTVLLAMASAILLSIPVAWVYALTRAKRGYQQSVVQLLIILPLVVAGIVVLVKYSLALAFGLAGIVAAVRFRNTLEDSKDAVYVFLATGIGLASAVDVPVAAAISLLFNATVLVLWYTDFGSSPVELEGRIAARRLERAKQLARTGTFVAQIDEQVFRNMSREQLEGVAQRAWRRAHARDRDEEANEGPKEAKLRIRTRNLEALRTALSPHLDNHAKEWKLTAQTSENGVTSAEFTVRLRKNTQPEELLSLVRIACAPELIDAELV